MIITITKMGHLQCGMIRVVQINILILKNAKISCIILLDQNYIIIRYLTQQKGNMTMVLKFFCINTMEIQTSCGNFNPWLKTIKSRSLLRLQTIIQIKYWRFWEVQMQMGQRFTKTLIIIIKINNGDWQEWKKTRGQESNLVYDAYTNPLLCLYDESIMMIIQCIKISFLTFVYFYSQDKRESQLGFLYLFTSFSKTDCPYNYNIFKYLLMNEYEISKLRKQLQRSQEVIEELRADYEFTSKKLIEVQSERDKYHAEIMITRQTFQKVDKAIDEKITQIKKQQEKNYQHKLQEFQKIKRDYQLEKTINQKLTEENHAKSLTISELQRRFKEFARKYNEPGMIPNANEIKDTILSNNAQFYKLTQKYNKVCQDIENVIAENRILRKLHGVPENFGFDLEEIKIAQKQQLEDYKTQVKHLQAQVEELEAERTQLRYRLRQFNTLYSNKGERYKDFTPQQFQLLDEYALNLKQGRIQLPQIDKSKKQMQKEIIKLRGQIQILQAKAPIIQPQKIQPIISQQQEKISNESIKKYQEEIKNMLQPMMNNIKKLSEAATNVSNVNNVQNINFNAGQIQPGQQIPKHPLGPQFIPPAPLPYANNDWTKINQGFSYMFNSKIPVEMKDLYGEVGFDTIQAKYQVAALQLQNIQNMKIIKQKQTVQKQLSRQLMILKEQLKKCLLIQDDLFLKHFAQQEELNNKIKKLDTDKRFYLNEKDDYKKKLQIMEDTYATIIRKSPQDNQSKLIEITKRLAISQSEVMQLERKYKVISDQQKILRKSYTTLQTKASEIQYNLREKILICKKNEKVLSSMLNTILQENRQNVSADAHNIIKTKLQIIQDKYANILLKQGQLRKKISSLESKQREINIKEKVIDSLSDDNTDLMLQLEIIKSRLSAIDSGYRKFQDIFTKFVNFVKNNNISVVTFFKKFDTSGDGLLNRQELNNAFNALGFKLSSDEMSLTFSFLDLDGSGNISYKEFLKKLRRGGVTMRSKQQQGVYKLYQAIVDANFTLRKAFNAIDTDGSNTVSKGQMQGALLKMGIGITSDTVDYIFRMCDNDMDNSITYSEFEKIFEDIISQSQVEQKVLFETQLDWKYAVMLKIEECATKQGLSVIQVFEMLDKDNSRKITVNQLNGFFNKSGIDISRKNLLDLFSLLDKDGSKSVGYDQFLQLIREANKEKERIDRIKFIKKRAEQIRKEYGMIQQKDERVKLNEQSSLKMRMMALETKQKHFTKRHEMLMKEMAHREQEIKDLKETLNTNQKTILKIQEDYYEQKQKNIIIQQKTKGHISKEEGEKLKAKFHKAHIENAEVKSSLELYKGLYQSLINKSKSEELKFQKVQAEKQKFYEIVKDFQGKSDEKALIGKLTIELQQSKWNEGIVNERYDKIVDEIRILKEQNKKLEISVEDKQNEIINTHLFLREKSQIQQRNIDNLSAKILPTVTLAKVEELGLKLRQVSNSKSQLQLTNKKLRDLNFQLQLRNDYLQNEKSTIEELQTKLRKTFGDQSSITIMNLSKKLSEYKMVQLRCKRESALLKEKQDYYVRINHSNQDSIKELQEELAKWEVKYNQRDEFWRKRLADQVKLTQAIQEEQIKTKQSQRHSVMFLTKRNEEIEEDKQLQRKLIEVDPQRRSKLNVSQIGKTGVGEKLPVIHEGSETSKANLLEYQKKLHQKQQEIQQLKFKLKEYMNVGKQIPHFTDFNGQSSQILSSSINLQTDLTASKLRDNANRFVNNQKQRQQFFQQESEKLAQAAQQSIQTLQRIIDDKNQQLRRKEKVIQDLKNDFFRVKEQDTVTIQQLNEQLHKLNTKQVIPPSINEAMMRSTNKFGKKTDEKYNELVKEIQQKERKIIQVEQKYEQLVIAMQKKMPKSQQEVKKLQNRIRDLEAEKEIQMKKYEEQENELKKKIINLEKLSKDKDAKLAKLQKSLVDIKKDILKEKNIDDKEFETLHHKITGNNANDNQMEVHLQNAVKTIQQLTKDKKDQKQEMEQILKRSKQQTQEIIKLRQENQRIRKSNTMTNSQNRK